MTDVDECFHLDRIVRPGETVSAVNVTRSAGGKGANQACALARAGGAVDLNAKIGQDGVWIRDMLAEACVGVDRVAVVDEQAS